jgi:hypothetical protein
VVERVSSHLYALLALTVYSSEVFGDESLTRDRTPRVNHVTDKSKLAAQRAARRSAAEQESPEQEFPEEESPEEE